MLPRGDARAVRQVDAIDCAYRRRECLGRALAHYDRGEAEIGALADDDAPRLPSGVAPRDGDAREGRARREGFRHAAALLPGR